MARGKFRAAPAHAIAALGAFQSSQAPTLRPTIRAMAYRRLYDIPHAAAE